MRENQAVGTTLLYVQAEDSDHSANGEVIYTFSPSSQAAHGKLFDINEDTGIHLVIYNSGGRTNVSRDKLISNKMT